MMMYHRRVEINRQISDLTLKTTNHYKHNAQAIENTKNKTYIEN